MVSRAEARIRSFFDRSVTERERAIFEGGIALGTIYHQFMGLPVSKDRKLRRAVEEIIERTVSLQPYRARLKAKISEPAMPRKRGRPYAYGNLEGKNFDVLVETKYGQARAIVRMKYVPELDYTLMYIQRVTHDK